VKFTDGYWIMRPGVQAAYPAQVLDADLGPDSLVVHAPCYPVRERRDLLRGPALTVAFAAPLADVIRVTVTHFAGQDRKPDFVLADGVDGAGGADGDAALPLIAEDGEALTFTSGALTARIAKGPHWGVDFLADGRRLTGSGSKATAIIDTGADAASGTGLGFSSEPGPGPGRHFIREQLDLAVDAHVYGLGERFGPLVKNGQVVDSWNADGGTASEQAYKNVPFFLTDAGYGVFVNHPGRVSFEVASEVVTRTQFSVEGQQLEYFLIYGPTPREILRKYTALTGRPPRVPAWSYGLWLSTSFTTPYDEATVGSFVDEMARRDLPLSVFHFDSFWMREFNWCDFEWDPRTFPDPRGMLERLKARGLRICVWINPYIAQRSPLFAEAKAAGYLLKRANGDVWQWDLWQPGLAVVDFNNPQAREWFAGKLDALLEMGVDCFKSDFGERIPTDVVYDDGADPERMHNLYAYYYNQTVFELLRKRRGEGEALVFARSATAGSQQFPVHWGGDCESTFEAMAESLRGGLSLGLSGFGYWSHDIGGFEGTPDPAVFKRWTAFGLLSSHSRLHGHSSYRVPWLFDEEAVEVLRRFTKLKTRLMPYLLRTAEQAVASGVPMMRAMLLEFPDDPACTHLERQYMLGDDLLVAPVFGAEGRVSYYVPDGIWTHLLTGEKVAGPRWVTEQHGFDSLPLLARPGSVIAFGAVDDRPEYDYAVGVTLRVSELADGAQVSTVVPAADGSQLAEFTTTRRGRTIRVTSHGAPDGWKVQVTGIAGASVEGGSVASDALGPVVTAARDSVVITIED
jgi:alpha-D-xyloside xylohydrolase